MKRIHNEQAARQSPADFEYSSQPVNAEIRSLYGEIIDRIINTILLHNQIFQYSRHHEQQEGTEYVPDPAVAALEKSILEPFAQGSLRYTKLERLISELEAHLMNFSVDDDPKKIAESVHVYKEAILQILSGYRKDDPKH